MSTPVGDSVPTGTGALAGTGTRVLVPSGVLGLGFDREALARGIARRPDVIAIDGGSTDSGPYYLGTGTSKYADAVIEGEWCELLDARQRAGVPLIIGSAGTCGVDAQVDALLAITERWALDHAQRLRVATIRCEQPLDRLQEARRDGRMAPLEGGAPPFAPNADETSDGALERVLDDCSHIVALSGAEPFIAALESGADVIIAGRATDTALIAALPLARGQSPGAAWHAAKIAECGALCSTLPASGVVMIEVDREGFSIEALADGAACTPYTVSAHMLYENADPVVLHEPGGRLDVSQARYEPIDARSVRVTGSRWIDAPTYTVKLEGARLVGWQCASLVLIRDPHYLERLDDWCDGLLARVRSDVERHLALAPDAFTLELRRIGVDATLGALEFERRSPVEVGVLLIVTAPLEGQANEIARLANPQLLHLGLPDDTSMPSFAFPWSPAEIARGPLYGFCLDHVVTVSDALAPFHLELQTVGEPPVPVGAAVSA